MVISQRFHHIQKCVKAVIHPPRLAGIKASLSEHKFSRTNFTSDHLNGACAIWLESKGQHLKSNPCAQVYTFHHTQVFDGLPRWFYLQAQLDVAASGCKM